MFTTDQIRTAHGRVKSGADFPAYIQEIAGLGVVSYIHYVSDGSIVYHGADAYSTTAAARWETVPVTPHGDREALARALAIHQQGGTDYLNFCRQAAAAGVWQWTVDIPRSLCTYYDRSGNELLAETIPRP